MGQKQLAVSRTSWVPRTLHEFQQMIESALLLDLPYDEGNRTDFSADAQKQATPASVLILFGNSTGSSIETSGGSLGFSPSLLFTRRSETVETHKGQIAFPGGLCEKGDCEDPAITALRETEEEVGIPRTEIRVIGELPPLLTATRFVIRPIVGILIQAVEMVELRLSPAETAEAMWIPLEILFNPNTYRSELFDVGTRQYPIDVFQVDHYRIWGATGTMTKNLLDRIQKTAQGQSGSYR